MAVGILFFFIVISIVSALGYSADTRDSADWKPSDEGMRVARWR